MKIKELELIQQFEKDFIEAGKLAVKLRKNATIEQKFDSGIKYIDIVTSSDLAVQEFILKKLANSDLVNCEVVAEEDTPTKKLFANSSDLVITIDPIDGTMLYATGKKMYSVIIMLHDKNKPLYTFDYFPELNWGIKIVEDKCEFFGQKPDFSEIKIEPKMIAYSEFKSKGNPQKTVPMLCKNLSKKGYQFIQKIKISKDLGLSAQFVLGMTDGYFIEDGSAVDCLVGLHFGLANNYKIYRTMNIANTKPSNIAAGSDEYKGYYLVLRS